MQHHTPEVDPLVGSTYLRARFSPPPSLQTISRWIRRGLLPAPLKILNHSYWRKSALDAFLSGGGRNGC